MKGKTMDVLRMGINVKMTLTGAAVINISLTVDSTVPRLALAEIASQRVHTPSPVLTWASPAFIDILRALDSYMYIPHKQHLHLVPKTLLRNKSKNTQRLKALAFPAAKTLADIGGVIWGRSTHTTSLTGLRCTGDQLFLAVSP